MKNLKELLRYGDPLRHEPTYPSGQRDFRREAVLAEASSVGEATGVRSRPRAAASATVAFMVIAACLLGGRVWSLLFVSDVQAAVHFEVRLAEDKPSPGLREMKVSGSDRMIYLHKEFVVANGDIATAGIVQGGSPPQYSVSIGFNASGAQKMREATKNHVGKPLAILIDGQLVMAPVLRSPIGASAVVAGYFTKPQAERIVNGIRIH